MFFSSVGVLFWCGRFILNWYDESCWACESTDGRTDETMIDAFVGRGCRCEISNGTRVICLSRAWYSCVECCIGMEIQYGFRSERGM